MKQSKRSGSGLHPRVKCLGGVFLSAFVCVTAEADTYNIGTTNAIGTGTAWNAPLATSPWNPQVNLGPVSGDSISISGGVSVNKQINVNGATYDLVDFSYNDSNIVVFTGATTSPAPTLNIGGTLTKDGSGTLVFASKVSGGTLGMLIENVDVKAGTLNLGAGSIGGGSFKSIVGLGIAGTTSISSGATLNVAAAFAGGTSILGATTNNGTLNLGIAGSSNGNTSYRFNGLNGSGALVSGVQATAITNTIQFTQGSGSTATYSGNISEGTNGKFNLDLFAGGNQILSGNTAYSGTTRISSGGLFVFAGTSTIGGTAAAQISLSGGTSANGGSIIGVGNGDLTHYGTGAGINKMAMNGTAGFAAFGADRLVTFTNGALTWGGSGFAAAQGANPGELVLGHSTSTHKVTLTNDIDLAGGTRAIIAHDGTSGIDGSLSGVISSSTAVLDKQGAGTLELKGANTYGGGTSISAGLLLVNNSSGSATGTGAVNIAAGAGLGGGGSVSGLVTTADSSSRLGSDLSQSVLTLSGGLDASTGATFNFTLGAVADRIDMTLFTGSTADGGLIFNLAEGAGIQEGIAYSLLNFSSVLGLDAADIQLGSLGAGLVLDSTFGTDGFLIGADSLQIRFAAVPEPSTYALLVLGLGGLWFLRRRPAAV